MKQTIHKKMSPPRIRIILILFTLLCSIHNLLAYAASHLDEGQAAQMQINLIDVALQTPTNKARMLKGGWYPWDPYQYVEGVGNNAILTGLDIELQKLILSRAGFDVDIQPVSWKQHQKDLETGKRDVAMGAFYSADRAKDDYLTEPYRYEEDSVFALRNNLVKHRYKTVKEFLEYVKKENVIIGVVDGYRYASDELNAFINAPENQKLIIRSPDDNHNLNLLLHQKVDAFLADRIVGATIIWRKKAGKLVSEKRIEGAKAPIYMLLSRKSLSTSEFNEINNAVKDIKASPEYAQTVSWYLYPVMLMETTNSTWFYIIEMIGTIAFAFSGLVLAYRSQASFLGTFILALLPSFGGGLIRDIILGRFPVWFIQAGHYIYAVSILVVFAFLFMKFFHGFHSYYKKAIPEKPFFNMVKILDVMLAITDAIGLAAFTVTGVVVCMIAKTDPLWLWGPFFAFLTGAGGGILRDVMIRGRTIGAINGELYGEIAVFWGAFLSAYLFLSASDVDPSEIKLAVILTIVMCFLTRMIVYMFNIRNIYFSPMSSRQLSNKEGE